MDPKVADMKYNDLRQYAKDLGIANFNCPKPKKEEIMEAIRAHLEEKEQNKQQNEEKPSKRKITKTQKAIESEETSNNETTKTKKTKKIKEKTAEIIQDTAGIIEEAVAANVVTPQKTKKTKKSKKTEQHNEEKPTEIQEINEEATKKIKKVKKIKEKKVAEDPKPVEVVAELSVARKTPGRPRKKPIITEQEIQNQPETAAVVEQNNQTEKIKKIKTIKNSAKEIINEQEKNEAVDVETQEAIIKKTPVKKVKKVVKKKKTKSSSSLHKQDDKVDNFSSPIETDHQTQDTVEQNNVQDDFQLRLERDDDEFSNHAPQQQVVTTTTVTTTVILAHTPAKLNENESLMTNDESFHQQAPKTPQTNRTPQMSRTPQTATLTKSNRKSLNKASTVLNEILIQQEQQDQIYNSPVRPTRRSSARKSVQPEMLKSPVVSNTVNNPDLNITNDIQNTTFDKSIHEDEHPVNSQALPCNTFYKTNNNTTQEIVQDSNTNNNTGTLEKQKPKGARIVRPTQTVTCVIPVVTEKKVEEEIVSKKVEISKFLSSYNQIINF